MEINKSGVWGEVFASRYLRDGGYEIIAGNYRCRMGEIDIIARKDGVTVFTEVKTRGENALSQPKEAVDGLKQRRLIAAANYYMKGFRNEIRSRFDVIEIILDEEYALKSLNHIKNAF